VTSPGDASCLPEDPQTLMQERDEFKLVKSDIHDSYCIDS